MSHIFISHVEQDADVALELALLLEESGYPTWCYEVDAVPGLTYLLRTGRAVEEADAFLLLISNHSMSSPQVTKEVVHAHEKGKQFIPVLRGITHMEFQERQPEWRQAVGAAASIGLPPGGVARILPRITEGLEALGIHPGSKAEAARIEQILSEWGKLPGQRDILPAELAPRASEARLEPVATEGPWPAPPEPPGLLHRLHRVRRLIIGQLSKVRRRPAPPSIPKSEAQPVQRYVNLWFTRKRADEPRIDKNCALVKGQAVYLRVQIDKYDQRTLLEEAHPFPSWAEMRTRLDSGWRGIQLGAQWW